MKSGPTLNACTRGGRAAQRAQQSEGDRRLATPLAVPATTENARHAGPSTPADLKVAILRVDARGGAREMDERVDGAGALAQPEAGSR